MITGDLTCDGIIHGSIDTPYINVNELRAHDTEEITIYENTHIIGELGVSGNIICSGSIYANNLTSGTVSANPFWIAGKVNSAGTALSSLGRNTYGCTKQATGQYTITPSSANPFPNANYIIQLTCQVTGINATAHVVSASVSTTAFNILTYINGSVADCAFHFTVST